MRTLGAGEIPGSNVPSISRAASRAQAAIHELVEPGIVSGDPQPAVDAGDVQRRAEERTLGREEVR